MKTYELTGAALDWAVAQCEGIDALAVPERRTSFAHVEYRSEKTGWDFRDYTPSTNWAQAGPIIERERIALVAYTQSWAASKFDNVFFIGAGPTPLIAAMRCFVASKLGDEIEIPEELT